LCKRQIRVFVQQADDQDAPGMREGGDVLVRPGNDVAFASELYPQSCDELLCSGDKGVVTDSVFDPAANALDTQQAPCVEGA